ncbi:hypothetical protein ABIF79_010062 [Bradyrhizobium japonicum]
MLESVIEVLQEFVLPDIGIFVVLDADRVFPQTPREGPEIGMFDGRFVAELGPMFRSSLPTMSQSSTSSSTSKT